VVLCGEIVGRSGPWVAASTTLEGYAVRRESSSFQAPPVPPIVIRRVEGIASGGSGRESN